MVVIVNRFLKNSLSKIIDNPSCLLLSKKKNPLICSFHMLQCIQVNLDVLSSPVYVSTLHVQKPCFSCLCASISSTMSGTSCTVSAQ